MAIIQIGQAFKNFFAGGRNGSGIEIPAASTALGIQGATGCFGPVKEFR